jgi:hypothetical protein
MDSCQVWEVSAQGSGGSGRWFRPGPLHRRTPCAQSTQLAGLSMPSLPRM